MTTPIQPPPVNAPEVSSDDRLWVLLCFLFTPLVPIITLLIEEKKNHAFVKYHTIPTLILGIAEVIIGTILAFIPVVGCLSGLLWIINVFYGIKAYGGVQTDIPVITQYSKSQGWS